MVYTSTDTIGGKPSGDWHTQHRQQRDHMYTMENILLITDSRGTTLEDCFTNEQLLHLEIRPFKGLTLHELNERLPSYSFIKRVNKLYIMVGINDFTILDRQTHTVRLVTPFASGLIIRLRNEINQLEITMKRYYPNTPYVLCPLYGLDVSVYNKHAGTYRYQDVLDQAIIRVNMRIGQLNTRNGQTAPFICNVIHRYRPKKKEYITMYEKLQDGLHPSETTQRKIAKYLLRSFYKGDAGK